MKTEYDEALKRATRREEEEHWKIIFLRTLIKADPTMRSHRRLSRRIHCVYCCQRAFELQKGAAVSTGTAVLSTGTLIRLM